MGGGDSGVGSSSESGTTDASRAGPPAAAIEVSRPVASTSVGTARWSGTVASPRPRPKSRRWSPPFLVLAVGAHQVTTWDWARVRAT